MFSGSAVFWLNEKGSGAHFAIALGPSLASALLVQAQEFTRRAALRLPRLRLRIILHLQGTNLLIILVLSVALHGWLRAHSCKRITKLQRLESKCLSS